jgi:hypothetical protein
MGANQNFPTVFSEIANFSKICETVYGTEREGIFTNKRKQRFIHQYGLKMLARRFSMDLFYFTNICKTVYGLVQ